MCGIVGYVGKENAIPILIEGLKRLEYRGYDSAGIVVFNNGKISLARAKGRISELEKKVPINWNGHIGIAHTRWATHGEPSEINAHPHPDCRGKVFVCHNGIIENYKELKENLILRGHKFKSGTDTEVLSHLIEENLRYGNNRDNGDVERKAVVNALRQVRGTYGLAVVFRSKPDKIIVARNSSPLVIGIGKDENIVASDASAIVGLTQEVIYLHDGEGAVLTIDDIKIFNISRYRDFSRNTDQPMIKKTLNAVRVSKFKEFKDFDVLVEAIDPSKFYLNCDTNGWRLDEERAKHLKAIGVDRIQLSLDSLNPEEHDNFRKAKGAHARAIKAVENALNAELTIFIQTVVTKQRLYSDEFIQFVEHFNKLGIGVFVSYAKPVGAWEGNFDGLVTKDDMKYFEQLEKKYQLFSHLTPAYGLNMGCIAVKGMISVTHYGDVLPCPYIHISIGNVFNEPLKDIIQRGLDIKYFGEYVDTCLIAEDRHFIHEVVEKKVYGKPPPVPSSEVFTKEDKTKKPFNEQER